MLHFKKVLLLATLMASTQIYSGESASSKFSQAEGDFAVCIEANQEFVVDVQMEPSRYLLKHPLTKEAVFRAENAKIVAKIFNARYPGIILVNCGPVGIKESWGENVRVTLRNGSEKIMLATSGDLKNDDKQNFARSYVVAKYMLMGR